MLNCDDDDSDWIDEENSNGNIFDAFDDEDDL
jgi:hypothetical protein